MKYIIHDNGGRPYVVQSLKNDTKYHVDIIDLNGNNVWATKSALRVLPGYSKRKRDYGSTVLIQTAKETYVYVGGMYIKKFKVLPGDKIKRFISSEQNNDVFYPTAIGKNYTYCMEINQDYRKQKGPTRQKTTDKVIMAIETKSYPPKRDPYIVFYNEEFDVENVQCIKTETLYRHR